MWHRLVGTLHTRSHSLFLSDSRAVSVWLCQVHILVAVVHNLTVFINLIDLLILPSFCE